MKTLKTAIKIFLVPIFLLTLASTTFAFDYQSIENSGFDLQISDQTNIVYSNPKKILLVQIQTPVKDLENNIDQWIASLYYYSITRLNFADIPYNYILDENGLIYEGKTGGIGVNPELKTVEGAVTIGYMSNNPILTTRAERSLTTMVEEISYDWGINQYEAVNLKISKSENTLTTFIPEEINNDFSESVKEVLVGWKGHEQEHLKYIAKIETVENESTVEIGSMLKVKVRITNENNYPWFTDKNPVYISIKDGKESIFAVNGEWDSFSKPTHIKEIVVKPGESVDLEFNLLTKIIPGKTSESFEILKFNNQPFGSSSFESKFEIIKGDNKLIEVYSPQYGYVNIRECPRYNCKILESVDEGAVYIEKAREDAWVKIKYNDNTDGWIYSKYVKSI